MRAGDVYRISLDSTVAREELDWSPRTDLEDGLRNTVDYIKGNLLTEVR